MGIPLNKSTTQQSKDDKIALQFIFANERLVHPNVLPLVKQRNDEGICMALSQIHHGTLKVSREVNQIKDMVQQSYKQIEGKGKTNYLLDSIKSNLRADEAKKANTSKAEQERDRLVNITFPPHNDTLSSDKQQMNYTKNFLESHKNPHKNWSVSSNTK